MYYVYSLSDPRDQAIRYIGVTINPKERLMSHYGDTYGSRAKLDWIRDLRANELLPVMDIIEECSCNIDAAQKEKYYYDLHNKGNLVCNDPANSPYVFNLAESKRAENLVTTKFSNESLKILRLIAAMTDEKQYEVIDRLTQQELDRLTKK
ncbi:GIY-YIG nuclease family protein [Pontibacter qinzhouensis]|uniref:GIY-YIG nuclease family protein n=1 Tax=Pontibacter qinzhouensis TaxID=2603253 RepID=A0A5C8KF92_9BACT|nr:GIY-YIG nuclease family protein [Pontibacter qinzhouensis]TXK52355.1 GIY-YIG nuclease family protein [Pontibacter qinzhouensis]